MFRSRRLCLHWTIAMRTIIPFAFPRGPRSSHCLNLQLRPVAKVTTLSSLTPPNFPAIFTFPWTGGKRNDHCIFEPRRESYTHTSPISIIFETHCSTDRHTASLGSSTRSWYGPPKLPQVQQAERRKLLITQRFTTAEQ